MEFRDLKEQYKQNKEAIDRAIAGVIDNTHFISGPQVAELEKQLAEYVGVKHCIACGNGTDALLLALMAWDIKAGDLVFVPDFTFFSSAEVIATIGINGSGNFNLYGGVVTSYYSNPLSLRTGIYTLMSTSPSMPGTLPSLVYCHISTR